MTRHGDGTARVGASIGPFGGVLVALICVAACSSYHSSGDESLDGGSGGAVPAAGAGGASSGSGGAAAGGSSPGGSSSGGTSGGGVTAAGGTAGAAGATEEGGAAGASDAGAVADAPVILSLSATPPNLPAGGGMTTLSFRVSNADTLSIDQGVGTVSGTSKPVKVTATTIFTLTAKNAHGSAHSSTAVVIGQNPSRSGDRYVAMVSPNDAESFIAPASLRLVAAAHDPNVYTNSPRDGLGGNASKVQFFVDDAVVLEVDGTEAEYWMFKGYTSGVTAGTHRVWARAIYVNPSLVLDSTPMLVTVAAAPTYDRTVDLDADVVLSGAMGYELVGTADKRIRLNGNGHGIRSSGSASGPLTLRYVDAFDLGSPMDAGQDAIDVTTSGAVTIEDSIFDSSNTVSLGLAGSAAASIRRNTFRSNSTLPVGQQPDPPSSYPVVALSGGSTGTKVFAGNNVGAGYVSLDHVKGWVLGGDTDEDSNVIMGPRVGIHVTDSSDVQVRRNYSHHRYFGGWSQGNNFELQGSPSITVEHNVVYGSSWPARGVGCEFRYNLVLDAGHEWLWPEPNGSIHHNVFAGGEADVGGIYVLYDAMNVKFSNNTIDGMLGGGMTTAIKLQSGMLSATSNAFINVPKAPTISIEGGQLTADYNGFFNPQTTNYSDNRMPAHDVAGTDAMLTDPPKQVFDLDESSIWTRATTAKDVLSLYRQRYMPKAGSPLVDKGDPQGGAGNDIGAVGAGQANTADRFGNP